jgi:hypothetical protein
MFLNDWEDRGDTDDDAEEEVEGDEELVQLAVADVRTSVVRVAENDGDDGLKQTLNLFNVFEKSRLL